MRTFGIKTIVAASLACLLMLGCSMKSAPLSERMKVLVDEVEKNISTCSDQQRDAYQARFEALMDEYEQSEYALDQQEKSLVMHEVGRYKGLLFKSSISTAVDGIKGFLNDLPDIASGFYDSVMADESLDEILSEDWEAELQSMLEDLGVMENGELIISEEEWEAALNDTMKELGLSDDDDKKGSMPF